MIKKLKIGLLIAVLSLAVGVGFANAAAILTWTAATTIDLSSPDMNLSIPSGATAQSIVIGTGTITPTLASGDVFTVATVGVGSFVVSPTTGVSNNCSSGNIATVIITATGSQAYTITPSATACTYVSSGGGGGGGTPADTTPPTGTSISINAGATTTTLLAATLTLGATDASQMLISNDSGFAGATWEAYATSKAWTLTSGDGVKTVYAKFKDTTGNMSAAISDTITVSGSGTVVVVPPPSTPTEGCSGGNLYNTSTGAACINNSYPQGCSGGNLFNTSTGNACVNNTGIPGCGNRTTGFSTASGLSCVGNRGTEVEGSNGNAGNTNWCSAAHPGPYSFGTKTLKNGSKGEAVKELQRFLNAKLCLGLVVDGKLGPKTIKVIKQWQKDHGLVVDGLVGAKTKAKMHSME